MHRLTSTACPLGFPHPLNSLKVHYCPRCLQTRGRRNRSLYLQWFLILFSNCRANLLTFHLIYFNPQIPHGYKHRAWCQMKLLRELYSITTEEIIVVVPY